MTDSSRDPIVNVVYEGIKGEIRLLLEHGRLRGALLLTLAGIDAMAFLGMAKEKAEVTRLDFIAWADHYIRFPCKEQVTGIELYGARCAALHAYGTESALSREGKCRQVGWTSEMKPEIRSMPEKYPNVVMASIPAFAEAFFSGVDQFLIDTYADSKRAEIANSRLKKLMHLLPGPGAEVG